tara:strand:- start:77 stop:430 length:354 start_codon:yes stop_codon:yes gene_type:complete
MRDIKSVNPAMLGVIPLKSKLVFAGATTSSVANNGEFISVMVEARKDGSAGEKLIEGRGIVLSGNTQKAIFELVEGKIKHDAPTLEKGTVLYCSVDYKAGSTPKMQDLLVTIALSEN